MVGYSEVTWVVRGTGVVMRYWRHAAVLLSGLLCLLTSGSEAQQPTKLHKIGHLLVGNPTPQWTQLWEELRRLGYIEGHNLIVERRYPQIREDLAASAADLLTRNVDIIVTGGTPAALAAKQATTTIPIIFSLGANPMQPGANPVQRGLVTSYERPGGNITGFVEGIVPDKKLEILKEALPSIVRVACPCRAQIQSAIGAAARTLGLELQDLDVLQLQHLDMQRPDHFTQFVEHARRAGADAILIPNLAGYGRFLPLAAKLATENRIPAIGFGRSFVDSGGLLSFGPKEGEGQIAVASMVHRIFQGAKPGDISVVQQRDFTLAVNLKTAENLGVTISPSLLNRVDEEVR
jgi:putative tryptophan/tyrosine transport system substrate-binding protein